MKSASSLPTVAQVKKNMSELSQTTTQRLRFH